MKTIGEWIKFGLLCASVPVVMGLAISAGMIFRALGVKEENGQRYG